MSGPADPVEAFREQHRAMVADYDARGVPMEDDPENDPATAAVRARYDAGIPYVGREEQFWYRLWDRQAAVRSVGWEGVAEHSLTRDPLPDRELAG
jgi:hypothetical protein